VNMMKIFHKHVREKNNETHWNCSKSGGGIRKTNEGGEFYQNILYACMEISQWNPLVW
jgi:hypothetical protein